MKKLFFALSLFCMQSFIFSAQEAEQAPQLQEQDITPEHFEKKLHLPVKKCETENHILFFGALPEPPIHPSIRASLHKATGKIEIDVIYHGRHKGSYLNIGPSPSPYNEFPSVTYNALQALHEKQQEERKQNS